jgi:putative effector of murein hydrolase
LCVLKHTVKLLSLSLYIYIYHVFLLSRLHTQLLIKPICMSVLVTLLFLLTHEEKKKPYIFSPSLFLKKTNCVDCPSCFILDL